MNSSKRIVRLRGKRQRRSNHRGASHIMARLLLAFAIITAGAIGFSLAAVAGSVGAVYAYYARDLPDSSELAITQETEAFETVKIYDRTGQHLLYEVVDPRPFRGDRTYLRLEEMPEALIQATVALEDRTFFGNLGIDPRGLARALVSTFTGSQVQGGSSITQQLIKNTLIPLEERYVRSVPRKIKEVILALEITRRYSKDQILEWYLNTNFYGNFAYGPEAAARIYFDKNASELTLAEAAMLATIPQYPALNPIDNPDWAKSRQQLSLSAMVEAGYISSEQADQAYNETIHVRQEVEERFNYLDAPHFSLYVLDILKQRYNTPDDPFFIWRRGLRVYTTLDFELQKEAEVAAREHVAKVREDAEARNRDLNVTDAAVVAIRPQTGEILTMVGSLDYNNQEIKGQVNMAISPRQPGSSFKPYTYLTAFEQGYSPATMVMDVRTVFPDPPNALYVPENYDRKYHGPQSLRTALANSFNIPAVWLMNKVGVKNVLATAHRLGINDLTEEYYGLSLTLGGGEVTLLDHAYAFGVLANGGVMAGEPVANSQLRPGYRNLNPVAILQVVDKDENSLYQYDHPQVGRVVDERHAYMLTNVMSDNYARAPMFGLNNSLILSDRPVAAKTGTTNDARDVWTVGFTPQLSVGVWMGNADYEEMGRITGAGGAAPIWQRVMTFAHRNQPAIPFTEPPGLSYVAVCVPSGLLPTDDCPAQRNEMFIAGREPTLDDDVYQALEVNRDTGKLATEYTPRELVERRVYEIYPPEAADWVREKGIPQPPRVYDDAYGPTSVDSEVALTSPSPYSFVRGIIPIVGNARPGNFRSYKVEFGLGINPGQWTQIGPEHYDAVGNAPLEYLDTFSFNGLYTLRLTTHRHDGGIRTATVQMTIDNISPTVSILYPFDDQFYVMESDEWVSITANATDDWSMDYVEFYMDEDLLGTYTVAPYSHRWNIAMSDEQLQAGEVISETQPVTNPDGFVSLQEVRVSEVITETLPGGDIRLIKNYNNGRTIISDSGGYTETHVIKVKAFDMAGNVQESEETRIHVTHKREEKEEETSALWREEPVALLPKRSNHWRGT